MILVISSSKDRSTWDVLEWLDKIGLEYIFVNEYTSVKVVSLFNLKGPILMIEHKEVSFEHISAFWYRRGRILYRSKEKEKSVSWNNSLVHFENTEVDKSEEYLHRWLSQHKRGIGEGNLVEVNKLEVLESAIKHGLDTPFTLITTSKAQVMNFYTLHGDLIIKPISEVPMIVGEKLIARGLTKLIQKKDISTLADTFPISCFQKKIDKDFEVRSFYLNGDFFSMAIFSQQNKKTRIDFRNYDWSKPNRCVPFKLPKKIEIRLDKLMKDCGFTSGSIDIIVSQQHYYFLEINPIGQFGMTSYPCNYNIEKTIANSLKSFHNKHTYSEYNY